MWPAQTEEICNHETCKQNIINFTGVAFLLRHNRPHCRTRPGRRHGSVRRNDNANNDPNGSWDAVLATYQNANYIDSTNPAPNVPDTGVTANGASYMVAIADNVDDDPSMVIDSDKIIVVTSTGTVAGKTITIASLMKNNAQDNHISQEHYGEQSRGVAQGESGNVASTNRGNL